MITVPLAFFGFGYWSVIIGNLIGTILKAILLSFLSKYNLKFYFAYNEFKDMFSFSFFALLESLSSWLVNWSDTFFIGTLFSAYYLGLYKNSISMVNSLIAIITSAFLPILYSVLSRYQNDRKKSVKRICEVIMRNEKSILPVSHIIYGVYDITYRYRSLII